MAKYAQSLAILNRLISELQANTGGEPLLPEEGIKGHKGKAAQQPKQAKEQKDEVKGETGNKEKKQTHKKDKKQGGKQPTGKEAEKKKLPEGADPDLLIFSGVDMRVSEMLEAWKHPDSTYLYCEKIQVGKELRLIASGLQANATLDEMKGRVIVMANLKPRSMGGFESNGMVVCASDKDNKYFQILRPVGEIGERLYLDGYENLFEQTQQIIPVMNKKTLERFLKYFHTDHEGYVIWKDIKVRTKGGYLKSKFINGNVS